MAAGSDAQPADSRRSAGPEDTQRDLRPTVVAELDLAGLTDAVEIGRGGFGTVYRCEQTELDRTVAVKVLRSDVLPSDRARFLREERAMGRLTGHPNIVDVLTVDVTVSGRPFIVMPFHSRGSLDDLVRRDGPLAWQETVRIGVKLAGAIASAHALGILHRDVKPANILVTSYGEPQLTDFGVARLRGGFESAVGEIAGSPAFMAPELLSGAQPDERSDVYSLGATLFALLTGHAAFERRAGEQVLAQFVRITSQPVRSLWTATPPDDVSAAVEAAMAIEPGERPASAAEFGEMLQAVLVRHGLPSGEMTLPVSDTDRQARIDHAPDHPLPAASGSGAVGQTQVTRERLVGLVTDARSTLVRADAGFGKTAVLGQVRDLLRARNIPSVWLDGRTTSAVPFDRRLARALDAARGRPVVLVDDWHLIDADAASAAIRILEDSGQPRRGFVVTARTDTPAPAAELEIDSAALQFDVEEARELLLGVHGLVLDDREVRGLYAATRGWVTALTLVALALRGGTDPTRIGSTHIMPGSAARAAKQLERMRGRNDAMAQLLLDHVLDAADRSFVRFLYAIAVPDRVCGKLASELAPELDAATMLTAVYRRNIFLHNPDGELRWFELTPAVRDMLVDRLEQTDPAKAADLRVRVARWLAVHPEATTSRREHSTPRSW